MWNVKLLLPDEEEDRTVCTSRSCKTFIDRKGRPSTPPVPTPLVSAGLTVQKERDSEAVVIGVLF